MWNVPAPAKRLSFPEKAVPSVFPVSKASFDAQLDALVKMADRAGLHVARDFVAEMWALSQDVPEQSPDFPSPDFPRT